MKYIKLTKKDYPKIQEDALINLDRADYFEKIQSGDNKTFSILFTIRERDYLVGFDSVDDRDWAFEEIYAKTKNL